MWRPFAAAIEYSSCRRTLTSSNGADPNEMADPANAPLKPNVSVLGFRTTIRV